MEWKQIAIQYRDMDLRKKKEVNYKSVLLLYFLNFFYSDKSLIISHRACLSKPRCLGVCVCV